jgi:opacity protein-like surface antigen
MNQRTKGLLVFAMAGGLSAGMLLVAPDGRAQTSADPELRPTERGTIEPRGIDEGAGPTMRGTTPRTDQAVSERERMERERVRDYRHHDRDHYRHRHRGETYVAGFGGLTFGGTTDTLAGRGTALGQSVENPDLKDSIVYGMKIGYFHPGRLNWLGLEIEGYNATPHVKQTGLQPGSHLRVTTLGLNAIARTKMGCRDRDDRRTTRDHRTDRRDDPDYSPLAENARCPVHVYAGAGLGVFFAETSNQFGRSSDNGRAGLNALAGVKYFFNEHVSMFAEYKFNYVDLKFDQNQQVGDPAGPQAGVTGIHMINHVVGGLAVHF